MDEELRGLERLAQTGDPEAQAAYGRAYDRIHGEGSYTRLQHYERDIQRYERERDHYLAMEQECRPRLDQLEALIDALPDNPTEDQLNEVWHNLHALLEPEFDSGDINWYEGYAPGSGDPDVQVFTADWNAHYLLNPTTGQHETINTCMYLLGGLLERIPGVDLNWSDQISSCQGCNRAIETEPTSYSWTPSYAIVGGELLCRGCIQDDPDELLDEYIGNAGNALSPSLEIDPGNQGFTQIPLNLATGWHPGQTANPQQLGESLTALGFERWLFMITGQGQFDTHWAVYVDDEELEEWAENELDADEAAEALAQLLPH